MINNSRAGAESYAQWIGVDPGAIGVVYNGIDVGGSAREEGPRQDGGDPRTAWARPEEQVVGTLARFTSEKRPQLWLEGAARLAASDPDARFIMIGDGVDRESSQSYAQDLGLGDRIHFVGLIEDVAPWYEAMDAVLMTSSREGTSNTALEAQALGRPIVVPEVGGMAEAVLHEKTGVLMSANPSPDEIGAHLQKVLDNRIWREHVAFAGPSFIRQRFSIDRMAKDTFDLYEIDAAALKVA